MNTQFFTPIGQMNINGNLLISISKGAGHNLIVSVMIQNDMCEDEAKNLIPPLILKGTAEELDAGFLEKVTAPLQTASGLMDNMESFLKQLEDARKQSAMEREKTDKEKKEKETRDKKYNDAMRKADELVKEGKYREAWLALPKTADFPEHAETIRKRQDDFSRHFAPDLFSHEETPAIVIQ